MQKKRFGRDASVFHFSSLSPAFLRAMAIPLDVEGTGASQEKPDQGHFIS